ncbi:MAG: hypothetical protein ACETVZ_06900 [Phycisphaerae bacterium]
MKSIKHKLTNSGVTVAWLVLAFLFLGVVGCASTRSGKSTRFQVIPVSSQYVAALSADDIVRVMRRAGFSDEQILELGTQLRNALLLSGAVQIKQGNIVEAIFAINDNNVYVTARLRGNFIYDMEKGSWIRFGTASPRSQPKEPPAATLPGRYPRSTLQSLRDRQTQSGGIWRR